MVKKFFIILFFLLGLGFGFDAQAFSISPLKYSATIAPGESKDWSVKIKNDSDQGAVFSPVVLGEKQDNLGRAVFDKDVDIAEKWFQDSLDSITLAAGESKTAQFNISVPLNTPPGAHYLGLAVRQKSGQSLSAQLVTTLNLQVAGIANESLLFEKFFLTKKIFFDKNWLGQLQIRNIGNVSLDLVGHEDLFYFGKKISGNYLALGNSLFAQSDRLANLNLFVGDKLMLPGFYQAEIKIIYGLTHQTAQSNAGFWYLPWWSLVVLILIVFLILFLLKKNKNATV